MNHNLEIIIVEAVRQAVDQPRLVNPLGMAPLTISLLWENKDLYPETIMNYILPLFETVSYYRTFLKL